MILKLLYSQMFLIKTRIKLVYKINLKILILKIQFKYFNKNHLIYPQEYHLLEILNYLLALEMIKIFLLLT